MASCNGLHHVRRPLLRALHGLVHGVQQLRHDLAELGGSHRQTANQQAARGTGQEARSLRNWRPHKHGLAVGKPSFSASA